MLCPWCPPWVIQLEALIAEIGSAVSAALGGLQSLRRFTELAHHSHTAETYCVSVPDGGMEDGRQQGEEERKGGFRSCSLSEIKSLISQICCAIMAN